MAESKEARLFVFGSLYFVQGVALAYFRNFQKPFLDSYGISAVRIGLLTSILLLPFVLKIFIGMISDRVSLFGKGYRKPYIIFGLLLAVLSFGLVSRVSPGESFLLFSTLIIAGSFSVTLFDSATDGLAIDVTPSAEHGRVQGIMVGGRAWGFIILSLVFGFLAQGEGYSIVFLLIAAFMFFPFLFLNKIKEPLVRSDEESFDWKAFRCFLGPQFVLFALYAIFYSIVSFGVDGLVTYFMSSSFNSPETAIGTYGALRGIGAAVGAIVAGLSVDRKGRKVSTFIALLVISLGSLLISVATGTNYLLTFGIFWGFAWGFQETVFFALAMGMTDKRIAASMFAILMAVSNIGTAIGEGVATSMTTVIGFRMVFVALALLNIVNIPVLVKLFNASKVKSRKSKVKSQ